MHVTLLCSFGAILFPFVHIAFHNLVFTRKLYSCYYLCDAFGFFTFSYRNVTDVCIYINLTCVTYSWLRTNMSHWWKSDCVWKCICFIQDPRLSPAQKTEIEAEVEAEVIIGIILFACGSWSYLVSFQSSLLPAIEPSSLWFEACLVPFHFVLGFKVQI